MATLEELQSDLEKLRADYDSHTHDGSNSRTFETLQAQTINAHTSLIKKTSYADTQSGIWMGFVAGVFKMNMGTAVNSLMWDGSALNIIGAISGSTITGGTIQTAASGARIVMAGADNTIRVYDTTGQVIGIGSASGVAIDITPTAGTNNGIIIDSAIGGNGFYYTNSSDVSGRGLYLAQLSSGLNNNLPAAHIIHAGPGQAIFIDARGLAVGNLIQNTGIGINIDLQHTVSDAANIYGIRFILNNSGAGLEYAFDFSGSEAVAAAVAGTQNYKVRVKVSGVDYFIPLYTA